MAGLLAVISTVLTSEPSLAASSSLIDRGAYLAKAGDCAGCHTAPGGKPFSGGLYMPTPVGKISTPNITPDRETGIGDWSDDQFYRAMHEGIGHNGEFLYPVFPFPWYTKVTRDDVLAIKAYLFSLAPVHAPRQPIEIAFPFNFRPALEAWRLSFFTPATFAAKPEDSVKIQRGAYLVEGLGHCGECHNHDNLFGASDWSGRLKGGQIEGWYAPNLTDDGTEGVGHWTEDQIALFLKTGKAPHSGVALGPMSETINDSLKYLTDADLHAIAAYLKSVSAQQSYQPVVNANAQAPRSTSSNAYLSHCAFCHGVGGQGIAGQIPALAGNGAVTTEGPENVIRVVLGGLPASHGMHPMPAVGAELTDQDVADIVNYVRTAWGNSAPANAQAGDVGTLRSTTPLAPQH
jgi:mono/diheme cytochrome c family protein